MIKASIDLQDLRRRIYVKAKAEPSWRFWGLYVHVCKTETLREAYEMAKKNDGAPGVDGVTFEAIEAQGADALLEQIRDELIGRTYKPLPARRQAIPKDGGKVRVLSIPAIRDRVAQGALKLILEPIFEADFQPGSFGYRPKRTAHDAVQRVAEAIVQQKTRVLDFDLRSYFDNVRRAVQRSIVSPFSNGIEEFEGQRRTKDSLGRKSLNLCEATESFGGCLEVIRTFPLAARNNPRSAARRRQTLPTAACPAVFHFRDCERCQLVSRHPHLHQGPSATAEQSL